MAEFGSDGDPNDARDFFKPASYNYVGSEHTKAVSGLRGELSGQKGIRGVFSIHAGWSPNLKRDGPEHEAELAKAEQFKGEARL